MLYTQNYPVLSSPPNQNNVITHDHKGRKLSPALSNLLSTTIIPKPKKLKSNRPKYKLRADSNSSSNSTSSAITCNSLRYEELSSSVTTTESFISLEDDAYDHTSSTITIKGRVEEGVEEEKEEGETVEEELINLLSKEQDDNPTYKHKTYKGAFKSSIADLIENKEGSGNSNKTLLSTTTTATTTTTTNPNPNAIPIPKISYIQRWIDDNISDSISSSPESPIIIGSVESTNSITSVTSNNSNHSNNSNDSYNSDNTNNTSRRNKLTIPTFEPIENHPLIESDKEDYEEDNENIDNHQPTSTKTESSSVISKTKRLLAKKSLVSNLTASFKAISSMASSLSNSQQIQTSNYLSFGPRSMDEPHPSKLLVIRNPSTQTTTTTTTTTTPTPSTTPPTRPNKLKPVLLKTYNIQTTLIPGLRPRELRMNSDFYRIYAVELLMKMNGKIDEKFVGRAQMILEPRQDNNLIFQDEIGGEEIFGIRKRFVSSFDIQDRSKTNAYIPTSNLANSTSINDF